MCFQRYEFIKLLLCLLEFTKPFKNIKSQLNFIEQNFNIQYLLNKKLNTLKEILAFNVFWLVNIFVAIF